MMMLKMWIMSIRPGSGRVWVESETTPSSPRRWQNVVFIIIISSSCYSYLAFTSPRGAFVNFSSASLRFAPSDNSTIDSAKSYFLHDSELSADDNPLLLDEHEEVKKRGKRLSCYNTQLWKRVKTRGRFLMQNSWKSFEFLFPGQKGMLAQLHALPLWDVEHKGDAACERG